MAILSSTTSSVVIETADVSRFYSLYSATGGLPTTEQLQRDYLDLGTSGLHRLVAERHYVTAAAIAANIAKHPDEYENARHCMDVLPSVKRRVSTSLERLRALYPEAEFPPLTIVVSRGKPAGIADASGVIISLETLCAVNWMNANLEDRFVHVISHEYTHVQQALEQPEIYNDPKPTVLKSALIEGAAEFSAELISGQPGEVTSPSMAANTRDNAKEIESRFVAEKDQTDLSRWIDNSTMTTQGDLGYWVGYRIIKSYYQHATNKRDAFREIIQMNDPKVFLSKSLWYPGIDVR